MKTLFVFFLLSISAFSAPPSASELKVRQIWANHYKKEGYDFDIKKMSASDMKWAVESAESEKKLEEAKKNLENAGPETLSHRVKRYKLSAAEGVLDGMMGLASCYFYGEGVDQDYVEAVNWSQKSIERANKASNVALGPTGIWLCHSILGECYLEGKGVDQDLVQAVALFRKAAEEGGKLCQYHLGKCYAKGIGVPKDDIMAYMWLNLSATGGDAGVMSLRDSVARGMASEQISEAQRLSREWKPKK